MNIKNILLIITLGFNTFLLQSMQQNKKKQLAKYFELLNSKNQEEQFNQGEAIEEQFNQGEAIKVKLDNKQSIFNIEIKNKKYKEVATYLIQSYQNISDNRWNKSLTGFFNFDKNINDFQKFSNIMFNQRVHELLQEYINLSEEQNKNFELFLNFAKTENDGIINFELKNCQSLKAVNTMLLGLEEEMKSFDNKHEQKDLIEPAAKKLILAAMIKDIIICGEKNYKQYCERRKIIMYSFILLLEFYFLDWLFKKNRW